MIALEARRGGQRSARCRSLQCLRSPRAYAYSGALRGSLRLCGAAEGTPLQQGVVSAAEHVLGLLQSVDLTGAGLLTHVEVLQQPITFGGERRNVLQRCHELLRGGGLGVLRGLQVRLEGGLGGLLCRERAGVRGTLGRGVRHHLLVLLLRLLLCGLALCQLLVQVLDEHVDHRDHARAVLGLLRVGAGGRRRLSRPWVCARTSAKEMPVPAMPPGGAVGARVPPMLTTTLSSAESTRLGGAL